MGRRPVAALARLMLLPLAASACGTTASVETRSGSTYEAHILGGSPGSVYLGNKENGRFTLPRDEIADVDYPGNLHILGGLALAGFGGWRLRVGDTSCATFGNVGNCVLNVAPTIVGILLAGWGGFVWGRSRHAFRDQSKLEPDPVTRPGTPRDPAHPPGWRKPDPFADPHP
ncbi:MAG TPA: hypothetical protein VKQ32_16725 [Polyangia bacterium]|nr:hypothetical protein [Polyangia bacterium]